MPADCASTTCLPKKHPSRATVLLIEDNDDLATLLEYRLSKEGFTPLIAGNGEEAIALLETATPIELILLDILLPAKNGWDVCRCIRQHPEQRISTLPVIMLTALSAADNRIKGMECGADAYLTKPYSIQEVVLLCRKLITDRKKRHELQAEVMSLRQQEENSTITRNMLFHELRTQFTVIGGLCQRLLKGGDFKPGQAKGRNHLQVINHSVSQVSEMADEMLLLAKLDSDTSRLQLEYCHLDEIVNNIITVHRSTAQRKMVTIHVSPLPKKAVRLHRLALKIIISSLVENAIKYCPPSSVVSLEITANETAIHLAVHDQGPGIPLHEQQHIFTPYFRGEAIRNSHKGTGLGLFSVKRLTQELGGEVRLTSVPGEGSVFHITFPRHHHSQSP